MKSTSKSQREPAHSILLQEVLIRYRDTGTKHKINKHLTDINDTITDDDIRNIDTNITLKLLNPHKSA